MVARVAADRCYHCHLPVPPGSRFSVSIDGERRHMCCPGCQAVATAIVAGGLSRFYRYRSSGSEKPRDITWNEAALAETAPKQARWAAYDLPPVQEEFLRHHEDGTVSAVLSISGITCAACAWLIEHHLQRIRGVTTVAVNVSAHRCRVAWQADTVKLSRLLQAFAEIGYEALPAGDESTRHLQQWENRRFLLRLGIAGIGMMQAGMLALALYAGAFSGMEAHWERLLRWVSLLVATPVVFYSAAPFFSGARNSLSQGHLTMDVPVALAIGLAYGASAWATVFGGNQTGGGPAAAGQPVGDVYFDSVAMLTFFLLLGRYLEMRIRHRNDWQSGGNARLIPAAALKVTAGGDKLVPVKTLRPGDIIRLAPGDHLPCDGEIIAGESRLVEAVLTGEERPVAKTVGDAVSAGTINADNPLRIRVAATGAATRLAAVLDMVEDKPPQIAAVDRIAGWFVGTLLVVATVIAGYWWQYDPSRALWITLSVLVVTCPCALSLATPAALSVASAELRRRGFLIRRGHVLESLAAVDHIIFDKTGTLTRGDIGITQVLPCSNGSPGYSVDDLLAIAAALEKDCRHPIARAFDGIDTRLTADSIRQIAGAGITGVIDDRQWAIGKPDFVRACFAGSDWRCDSQPEPGALLLASADGPAGWIHLSDRPRPAAKATVEALRQRGQPVELLSGDHGATVAAIAQRLGIDRWRGDARPEDKLARLRQLQQAGHRVLMVGDGINDVPVLQAADVSVAVGDTADLTRLHADSLLLSGNLERLVDAMDMARRTRAVVRQNLLWALCYNLLALPLAAAGLVPPWAAAIGMSASSLLVVLNALRLSRREQRLAAGLNFEPANAAGQE